MGRFGRHVPRARSRWGPRGIPPQPAGGADAQATAHVNYRPSLFDVTQRLQSSELHSYNGGAASSSSAVAGANTIAAAAGGRGASFGSGQNRPNSASCCSGIQCRRGPAQARLDGTECACNARTNVHLHARTNVRRRAPGQVLSGTFGTHSPSQSTTGSPCGESSSSRVRRWLLARSTGFSILVLHMLTWCRRLSRSGCALCSVARAAVTAAERCGCRGGAVLYRSSGSSRLEHRRLFSTKPRATASCNAHA